MTTSHANPTTCSLPDKKLWCDIRQTAAFHSAVLLFCTIAFSTLAPGLAHSQTPEQRNTEAAWKPLFNGVDLSGWVLVNTPPDTWSFNDGVLACTGKPIGEIRTEGMYQNFILEIEWRHLKPAGNAGIFVWADDLTARGVPFHRGVEVQVLENAYGNTRSHTTHGDIFPIHGATMKPVNGRGGSRAFPTKELSNPSPEWNHYRIVCNDGEISLAVNGTVVTRGTDASPRKGYICIESEGGVVEYRNGRIRELPDTPITADQVAVANRGYRSVYTGLDLSGWNPTKPAKSAWKSNDWVLQFDGSVGPLEASLTSEQSFTDSSGFLFDFRYPVSAEQLQIIHPLLEDPLVFRFPSSPSKANTGETKTGEINTGESNNLGRSTLEAEVASALEAPGKWNRIEIQMENPEKSTSSEIAPKATVVVNGKPFSLPARASAEAAAKETAVNKPIDNADQPARSLHGKIVITPTGPIDFANLFIR